MSAERSQGPDYEFVSFERPPVVEVSPCFQFATQSYERAGRGEPLTFTQMVMRPDTASPWIGLRNTGGLQVNLRRDDVEVEAVFDSTRGDEMVHVTIGDQECESPADAAYSLFASVADRLSSPDLDRLAVA